MKTFDKDGRRIRGYAIISKGDTPRKLQRGVYRIPSQSGNGDYIVRSHGHAKMGCYWDCSCPDWNNNLMDCKHIYALKFWLGIKDKLNEGEPIKTEQKFSVDVCPYCKSEKLIRRGIRKNRNVAKQRYSCKACSKRFVLDIAKKTKGDGKIVTLCLDLYFKGISIRKIQDHLIQFYDFRISHMTIQRWIRKFMAVANQHASRMIPQNIGGLWHADEQMIRNNGDFLWIWNCMDAKTRFLLANNVTQNRFIKDAEAIFDKAKRYGQPEIIVTDGLQSYRHGIRNVFKGKAGKCYVLHVRADGLTSRKKNNNKIERYHNSFRERDKVMRGFKGQKSAEFMAEAYKTYYNFVKPHMSLNGLTPSQVAGINTSLGKNRWLGLIDKIK